MLVIVGLIVLLLVGLVAIVGVLTNAGAGHPPIDFAVFGYHPAGATGTLFLLGIMVGVVASLGFAALITGARRSASRSADAPNGQPR
jgi:amino acid transporter